MSQAPVLSPVVVSERIQLLDILRGFAIFGILAVNMIAFSSAEHIPGYVAPPRGVQRALSRQPRDFADWARETAATGVWNP